MEKILISWTKATFERNPIAAHVLPHVRQAREGYKFDSQRWKINVEELRTNFA